MVRALLFFSCDSKAEVYTEVCEFQACGNWGLSNELIRTYKSCWSQDESGQGRLLAVAFPGVGYELMAYVSFLISSPFLPTAQFPSTRRVSPPRQGLGKPFHKTSSDLLSVPPEDHGHFGDHCMEMLRIYNQPLPSFLTRGRFPKKIFGLMASWGGLIMLSGVMGARRRVAKRAQIAPQELLWYRRDGGRHKAKWEQGSWAWCRGRNTCKRGCPSVWWKKGGREKVSLLVKPASREGPKEALRGWLEVIPGPGLGVVSVFLLSIPLPLLLMSLYVKIGLKTGWLHNSPGTLKLLEDV